MCISGRPSLFFKTRDVQRYAPFMWRPTTPPMRPSPWHIIHTHCCARNRTNHKMDSAFAVSLLTSPGALWGHMHRTCTTHSAFVTARAAVAMPGERAAVFERESLRSHVAVHHGPPLALPAHCFAGDDGRHRERHRRGQEPAHLCRVLQMGCLGASRGRRLVALSTYAAAMVINDGFVMVCVAPIPRLPTSIAARFWDFAGQTFSDPTGDAPVALYSWLAMESAQARPR